MGIKKSIQKLINLTSSMRIEEIINIMHHLGYNLDRIKGSHYIFTKPNADSEIIPIKSGQVKKIYLRQIRKLLDQAFYRD